MDIITYPYHTLNYTLLVRGGGGAQVRSKEDGVGVYTGMKNVQIYTASTICVFAITDSNYNGFGAKSYSYLSPLFTHTCSVSPRGDAAVILNIHLHFMSFLNIDMAQVVRILSQVRQASIFHCQYHGRWRPDDARSISNQYLLCWTGWIRSPHVKGSINHFQTHFKESFLVRLLQTFPRVNATGHHWS